MEGKSSPGFLQNRESSSCVMSKICDTTKYGVEFHLGGIRIHAWKSIWNQVHVDDSGRCLAEETTWAGSSKNSYWVVIQSIKVTEAVKQLAGLLQYLWDGENLKEIHMSGRTQSLQVPILLFKIQAGACEIKRLSLNLRQRHICVCRRDISEQNPPNTQVATFFFLTEILCFWNSYLKVWEISLCRF